LRLSACGFPEESRDDYANQPSEDQSLPVGW